MASQSPLKKMQDFCNKIDFKALGTLDFSDAVALTTLTAIDQQKKRKKKAEQALLIDLKSWFDEHAQHDIVDAAKKGLFTVELRYHAGKRGMLSINSELIRARFPSEYYHLLDGQDCISPERKGVAECDMVFLIRLSWRNHCRIVLERLLAEKETRKKQKLDDTSAANTLLDVSRNDDL